MLVAAFAFSLMTLFVKLAGERLPTQEVIVARALMTLLLTYAALRRAGIPPLGSRRPLLWVRGLFGLLSLSCTYYSVTHLPLAEATVIQYIHPPITATLAAIVLKERFERSVSISMGLGLIGLLLVAQPAFLFGTDVRALDPFALLVAVGGGVFSSCAIVTVRKLGASEDPLVIVFYFPFVALPLSLPILGTDAIWPEGIEWLWLVLVGIFTQIGQVSITRGLRYDAAGRAAAYAYLQVPLAALWGALAFGAFPNRYSLLGGLFIMSGAVLNVHSSRPKP
jgi:drug/metabolite transporter (DMT)-like permease